MTKTEHINSPCLPPMPQSPPLGRPLKRTATACHDPVPLASTAWHSPHSGPTPRLSQGIDAAAERPRINPALGQGNRWAICLGATSRLGHPASASSAWHSPHCGPTPRLSQGIDAAAERPRFSTSLGQCLCWPSLCATSRLGRSPSASTAWHSPHRGPTRRQSRGIDAAAERPRLNPSLRQCLCLLCASAPARYPE